MPPTETFDILLCTFRRPQVIETLHSLAGLGDLPGPIRVVVADNDDVPSAQALVEEWAEGVPFPVTYVHAPARNISIARNACLDAAEADWVVSLDDDEMAPPDWLAKLRAAARDHGADGVFGPVLAVYGGDAPDWMVREDFHSTWPVARNGTVETGISGNALLRWAGTAWQAERFDLARGRSGGEDTDFFFRVRQLGARFAIAPEATLEEPVPPARLEIGWLRRRRFRMGQSYAVSATDWASRAGLLGAAAAKSAYCRGRAAVARDPGRRLFWRLRGDFHRGVCSGVVGGRQAELYG